MESIHIHMIGLIVRQLRQFDVHVYGCIVDENILAMLANASSDGEDGPKFS